MKLIKQEEMLMGAEVRTLALFVRYELAETERSKKSLRGELSCEFKTKEPAEALPHHIGNGIYIFRRGDVIYELYRYIKPERRLIRLITVWVNVTLSRFLDLSLP